MSMRITLQHHQQQCMYGRRVGMVQGLGSSLRGCFKKAKVEISDRCGVKGLRRVQKCRRRDRGSVVVLAEIGLDTFLPALAMKPEVAVITSAVLATGSVVINFLGGLQLESKRAELQLELERDKVFQQQLREIQGVIARYRGPLLESAIDLEQRLWHLITDQCFGWSTPDGLHQEVRYFLFTLAQFLGFVEVLRRESPRERPFLQAGNPQGSDVLSTLIEAVRFFLCSSPSYLEEWAAEGPKRPHPGLRRRRSRDEVIDAHIRAEEYKSSRESMESVLNSVSSLDAEENGTGNSSSSDGDLECGGGCHFGEGLDTALLRVSRGHQRAIGTLMITTPMGAERHYTLSYGEFHTRLETDPAFNRWFKDLEADAIDLATGPSWRGEGPFPVGRWTRVLLLQQLLVELFDILDPDCVRLPASKRDRLLPVAWGPLPRLSLYQKRLQELSSASDFGREQAALQGLRDLKAFRNVVKNSVLGSGSDDDEVIAEVRKLSKALENSEGSNAMNMFDAEVRTGIASGIEKSEQSQLLSQRDSANGWKKRNEKGMTVAELERAEASAAVRAAVRAAHLEARVSAADRANNKTE